MRPHNICYFPSVVMYEACKVETPYPHQTGRPAGSPLDDRRETWLVTGPDLVAVSDSSGACVYMAVASAHLAETLLYPQSPPSPLALHLAIASMPTGVTRPSEPPLPGNERPSKRQARNHPLAGRGRLLLGRKRDLACVAHEVFARVTAQSVELMGGGEVGDNVVKKGMEDIVRNHAILPGHADQYPYSFMLAQ
ncbi:hypothetical protein C8Q72DRAFT_859172 [Fomitopsis betulina]|nr:hypothetical protein C8Q72DRAFT_859172 [Fomitopsis betulina]